MKLLSLFSGIGAFEKALDRLGVPYELVAYCEIDKYASKSYSAIHGVSEELNLGDITKADEKQLPKDIDLITYGFPCQDISIAGAQKGLFNTDGTQTRSGLFFEALRIIEETKPCVAIAENVKNLTGKNFAEQFKLVLKSLEQAGYRNYWKVLNAKHFGVPQSRERVFIVSIRKDIDNGTFQFPEGFPLELRLKDVLENEVDERYYISDVALAGFIKHKERNQTKGNGFGFNVKFGEDVAPTIRARYYKDGQKCLIADEPTVKQIGNCCPTKTRDNPNQGRIYDTDGLSPSLNCMGGGNRQPFVFDKPLCINSKGGRGGVVGLQPSVQNRIYDSNAIATAITQCYMPSYIDSERIRKLTPKETFRLMDFDDADYEKAASVNSNTQLYKQAGNSIVVAVPKYIIAQLIECGALKI